MEGLKGTRTLETTRDHVHSLDPTDRHTWPAVTTSLKECRVPLLRYKPNVPNAACLCKKPGALLGQRMLFRCWFCCLPVATDGRTEKRVRVTALDRALNMDDGRPMKAVHPEACMRMHWAHGDLCLQVFCGMKKTLTSSSHWRRTARHSKH